MMRMSVVLPAPFGPIRPTKSPASTDRVTPSTAWTAPIFFWKLNASAGIPVGLALVLTLLIMMAFGAVNGIFTAYIRIPSFVATLAMLFFLDGLSLILTHSNQETTPGTAITHTTSFAKVFGAGTYAEFFWAIGIVLILQIVLSYTRWGIYTVATGGNRLGADEAGIQTKLIIVRNFVSLSAGIAELCRSVESAVRPAGVAIAWPLMSSAMRAA